MIFSRFFQPAHQHSEPEKRLASIASMNLKQEKHKQILHELAFNDESIKVSIAALDALNSFTLWMKAYETHFHQKVQHIAKGEVLKLIEDSSAVSDALFTDIAKQHKHNVLLREMVFNSQRLSQMEALCVHTLLSICADSDIKRFYVERANDAQKRVIIDTLEEKSLKRFKKLENTIDVASYLDEKLNALEQAAAKPAKIIGAATLINSRLLALSDSTDYENIQAHKQSLINEFDALKSDFSLLTEEDSAQLTSKYFSIKERVDKRLAQLEPDYMASVHINAVNDAIEDVQNRAATIFGQIILLSESDSPEQLNSQIELLERAIADLRLELTDITNDIANQGQITAVQNSAVAKLETAFKKHLLLLANLPVTIARNSQIDILLTQATSALEQATADNAANTEYASVHSVESVMNELETLLNSETNAARKTSFKAIKRGFKLLTKAHADALKSAEKRCLSKLNVCANMIEQGKFKVAIATFNSAQKLADELASKSAALSRRYDDINVKINELKDWQSYIATPKKPALVAAALALAEDQQIDIAERASLVKQYRSEFTSLGRLHSEQDDGLNREFDAAIEKAFAPCRVHFAQLDQIREQNLLKGTQILAALEALNEVEEPSVLSKHISSISQQYRKLGDLDKKTRTQLHHNYQSKLKPLQRRVNAFYQANADAKQTLIDSAQKLSASDDLEDAVNTAKSLQTQWKAIAYAGSKRDQDLWQSFRAANDAVFKRLQDRISVQKQATHVQVQAIKTQIDALYNATTQGQSLSELSEAEQMFEQINAQLMMLPRAQQQALTIKLAEHQATLFRKIKSVENSKQNAVIDKVFELLAIYNEDLLPERTAALPSQFKQAFDQTWRPKQEHPVLSVMSRREVAVTADILLAEGKHVDESVQKKQVQLKLMAAKLEGQNMPDAESILLTWIGAGPLSGDDADDLQILKLLYSKR